MDAVTNATLKMNVPRLVPVILAGGSGTRFWPRSRRRRAKQVLALDGTRTMIQQTFDRLRSVASTDDVWVITNDELRVDIGRQLPDLKREHIVSEPASRNTAPACALAAFLLEEEAPGAVIGIFPSDHVVGNERRFAEIVAVGVKLASQGEKIVVLGVPATRPETGYGYIEIGQTVESIDGIEVRKVRRFTEKPQRALAETFIESGDYAWNSGMFLWSAKTLACAIREHSPELGMLMDKIAKSYGTSKFDQNLIEIYPMCENISIDYAVLEPRSARGGETAEIYCLPGDFSWNDLGSWSSLHEHLTNSGVCNPKNGNVFDGPEQQRVEIDAERNYVYTSGKAVALVGVNDLVVVETEDALLITTHSRSQDVGRIVADLKGRGHEDLI
jgi:mannose-1-phosphate guanylyltransferase